MGEYALYHGEQIKIGTCESMYYLRADQAELVTAVGGSVNPVEDTEAIRFRFPFPDEDGIAPGAFENYKRSVPLWGLEVPAELADEHYSVQFRADAGYNLSVPCPESGKDAYTMGECGPGAPNGLHPVKIHRNGFGGGVRLVQQKRVGDVLAAVVECGGCGMAWRLETFEDARPAIDSLIKQAKRRDHEAELANSRALVGAVGSSPVSSSGDWYRKLAERIQAGYRGVQRDA